jgi:hypothetical protein
MFRMRPLVLAVLLALLVVPWHARPAYACSCIPFSVQEAAGYAEVIATGRITAIGFSPQRPVMSSFDPVTATLAVDRYLKGAGEPVLTFRSAVSEASCGFLHEEDRGKRFLLFLRQAEPVGTGAQADLSTSLCSGNVELDTPEGRQRLAAVVAVTGQGAAPQTPPSTPPSEPPPQPGPDRSWLPVLVIVGGVVLLLTFLGAGNFRMTQGK